MGVTPNPHTNDQHKAQGPKGQREVFHGHRQEDDAKEDLKILIKERDAAVKVAFDSMRRQKTASGKLVMLEKSSEFTKALAESQRMIDMASNTVAAGKHREAASKISTSRKNLRVNITRAAEKAAQSIVEKDWQTSINAEKARHGKAMANHTRARRFSSVVSA